MEYPSRLIENAVQAFSALPGIGKKTAMRLVVHLLQEDSALSDRLSESIAKMRHEIQFCAICHNVADEQTCGVCNDKSRDKSLICVVENFRDILAIENTRQYRGVYHVLKGLISPMDGIGPDKLTIPDLISRVASGEVSEIIMALNPTIEGDTTLFYLSKQLSAYPVKITTISRGVAFGGELEFVDEVTLARSIASRLPYENYMNGR